MEPLHLALLGDVVISRGGEPVTGFVSAKALALLSYLAVTGRPHPRTELAGLLWGEMPEAAARTNLRKALSNLRRLAGPHLTIDRQNAAFNRECAYWLDVEEFSQIGARWADAADPLSAGAVAELGRAVELYRGDLLQSCVVRRAPDFEEWLLLQREALRGRALQALYHLLSYHAARTEYEAALRCGRRLVELAPWQEDAHRYTMLLLAATGQREAALVQYETCRRILQEEMGLPPGPETMALYEQLRRGKTPDRVTGWSGDHVEEASLLPVTPPSPHRVAWSSPHNLPRQFTPFVGRAAEMERLLRALRDPTCALVTVSGPGGVGKTRLAVEAASACLGDFPDGVYFIALEPVASRDQLIDAIARAVHCPFYGRQRPRHQLLTYLRERQILLVLDNFEHLLNAADLVVDIIQKTHRTKVLVTSRQRLDLHAEWTISLEGLPYPPEASPDVTAAHAPDATDAVQMFALCADRSGASVGPDAAEWRAVAEICRRVEGLPLALELAAALRPRLSCAAIAQALRTHLDRLHTTQKDVPARNRSLETVFERSWQLLSPLERRTLQRLSVFRGPFTREAAQDIAGASDAVLSTLVRGSLVQRISDARLKLHPVVRAWAGAKLQAFPKEQRIVHELHCRFYMALLAAERPLLRGEQQRQALHRIEVDLGNVRAAWMWAARRGRARLLADGLESLIHYCKTRNLFEDGYALLQSAREGLVEETAETGGLRGHVLVHQGMFLRLLGRFPEARRHLKEALATFQAQGMEVEAGEALRGLGTLLSVEGRLAEAEDLLTQSLALARTGADEVGQVNTLNNLGLVAYNRADFEKAAARFHASLALATTCNHVEGIAAAHNNLGMVADARSDHVAAKSHYQTCLDLCKRLYHEEGLLHLLNNLGVTSEALEEYADARRYYTEALALNRRAGERQGEALCLTNLGHVAELEGDLEQALQLLEESLALHRRIGDRMGAVLALTYLGRTERRGGRRGAARRHLAEALRMATEIGAAAQAAEAALELSTVLHADGRTTAARRLLERVIAHPASTEHVRGRAERQRSRWQAQPVDAPTAKQPA